MFSNVSQRLNQPNKILQKCEQATEELQVCAIIRLIQDWANLFNRRIICRKPKTPASCKISL